jgi:hypothetical protein
MNRANEFSNVSYRNAYEQSQKQSKAAASQKASDEQKLREVAQSNTNPDIEDPRKPLA